MGKSAGKSILFINSGSLPIPAVAGGAVQQVLYSIAAELAGRDWQVGVLTPFTPASVDAQRTGKAARIRWHRMEGRTSSGGIRGIWTSKRSVRKSLKSIDPADYDNVVIYDPYLAAEAKKWNPDAKLVWSVHNIRSRTAPLLRLWSRHMDEVVSVSRFLRDRINENLPVKSADRHTVIHNPLPEGWFAQAGEESRRPGSILFCGRIVPHKGLDILVKALAQLPEELRSGVELGIAGAVHFEGSPDKSEYTEHVRQLLENSGIRYQFLGFIKHSELHRIYDQYEILAIPSNWAEPATLVAAEGQSRRCVVIASTAGGLPEMVSPVWQSYMVPPGNDSALSRSIARALTEGKPDYTEEVSAWLRQEFDIKSIIGRWETILKAG